MSAAFAIPAIVAHQGGWDEALLVATPIVIIIVLLRIAKRRVDALHVAAPEATDDVGPADPSGDQPAPGPADDRHAGSGPA